MRTLVHLSDVHFGRTTEDTVHALLTAVRSASPDLVAVSGDLTQRARRDEFIRAREFLDALPEPRIVVPGNHDVPAGLYARFTKGLEKYRHYISDDLEPVYRDEEIVVIGLNTARSLTIKGGRINHHQMRRVEDVISGIAHGLMKIVVTHHPFDMPSDFGGQQLVGRARKAMARFARCGIDLFLAGHYHVSYCGRTAERYDLGHYSAIFVQAGTACSTRGRGEPNSFNVIRAGQGRVSVERLSLRESGAFVRVSMDEFVCGEQGWMRG